jgi:hypothetical protein
MGGYELSGIQYFLVNTAGEAPTPLFSFYYFSRCVGILKCETSKTLLTISLLECNCHFLSLSFENEFLSS